MKKELANLGLKYNTWRDYIKKRESGELNNYTGSVCYWTLKYYNVPRITYNAHPVFEIKIGMNRELKAKELATKKDTIEYVENKIHSQITYIELCNSYSGNPYDTISLSK